jgi:hypothetical protein
LSAASTATTKATEATTAAATATSAATTATTAKDDAVSAKTAAQTAQTGAETAAASVEASAEQIATNAEDISQLKSEFTDVKDELDSIRTVEYGENLNNPDAYTTGAVLSNGTISTAGTYTKYRTTDFLPLKPNTAYTASRWYHSSIYEVSAGRIIMLLYTDKTTPVSATYQNTDNIDHITFNSGEYAYVRFAILASGGAAILMVTEGTTFSAFIPYVAPTTISKMKLGETAEAEVESLIASAIAGKADITYVNGAINDAMESAVALEEVPGINKVDPTKLTIGAIQSNGTVSTVGSWANYKTSDYIPLSTNTDYVFSAWDASTGYIANARKLVLLFDSDKNIVSGSYKNIDGELQVTFNSGTASYARVSTLSSRNFMLETGTAYTQYIPYESEKVVNHLLGQQALAQTNILYGKKWAACGDSFTAYTNAQFTSGNYYGEDKTYPRLIALRNGMDLYSTFFASGRTLAYPSDGTFHNSLTDPNANCYYQNIPVDTDYITIMLGINDSHHASSSSGTDGEDTTGVIPIGTIDDATTATYYGAWNVVLSWLMENRPFAHIGILVSNGCDTDDYRTAQIAIATKYGVPYIDLNGDARTPVMIRSRNPQIASAVKNIVNRKQAVDYDGSTTGSVNTHPNWQAHEYESYFIENFLRSI